jgi:hypothetical protein
MDGPISFGDDTMELFNQSMAYNNNNSNNNNNNNKYISMALIR